MIFEVLSYVQNTWSIARYMSCFILSKEVHYKWIKMGLVGLEITVK